MIFKAIRAGIGGAVRNPGLTIMSWLWNLALAATLALPAFGVFSNALANSREAGQALDAFNLRVFFEIFHYDRTSVASAFGLAIAGLLLAALVGGALVGAGVVAALVTPEHHARQGVIGPSGPSTPLTCERSFLGRFFSGAGHLFARYLRLTLATVVAIGVVQTGVSLVAGPLLSMLANSGWEPGWIVAAAARALLLGVVVGFFVLAFDYARIRLATTDQRSALNAWLRGCHYVFRRPVATIAVGLAFALTLALLLGASLLVQSAMSAATYVSIAALIALQQSTMLLRAGVRVAQLAAETDLARRAGGLYSAPAGVDIQPHVSPVRE